MTWSPEISATEADARDSALRRLSFLAEASSLLAVSLDYDAVLRRIADLMVPALGDWCTIDMMQDDGEIRRVAVTHADPTRSALARELEQLAPHVDHPAQEAMRAGEGVLFAEITDDLLQRAATTVRHLDLLHDLGLRSALAVPMVARGRTIGCISLLSAESGRIYTEDDLSLAHDVARRAALAVDNARLFSDVQEGEQRYRSLVQSLDAIVWEAYPDPFQLRFVSQRAETMLGYPLQLWLTDPDFGASIIHPDDSEAVLAAFRTASTLGEDQDLEYRVTAADGRTVWIHVGMLVERDENGKPSLLRGLVTDVTHRKTDEAYERAQAAADHVLVAADDTADVPRDLLQTICETLDWDFGAVWGVDEHAQVLRCLSVWTADAESLSEFAETCMHMHFPRGLGLPGRVWATRAAAWIVDVENDPNFPRARVAARAGLRGGMGFPIVAGGRLVGVMEFFSRASRPPDEDLLALMATIGVQIGQFFERRRVEDALRESEARTRAIVDSAIDAVVLIDHEGNIVEFNPAAEQMFGYRREELIGRPLADLVVPPALREAHRRGVARYVATGVTNAMNRRLEMRAMRADRTEFPVELTITRVEVPGPPVFTGYIRDVTARASAERRRDAQHAVTRVLAESLTLEQAAPRVLEAICLSLDWHLGVLWEIKPRAWLLEPAGVWSAPGADVEAFVEATVETQLVMGEGVAGRVWEARQPMWFSDTEREGIVLPQTRRSGPLRLRGAFGFPIIAGNHVLGVLCFFNREAQPPDADLLGMLGNIGSQLGQFIVRQAAEEATRFQKAMLESQNEATIDGILITSPNGGIMSFNRRFMELFSVPEHLANGEDMSALGDYVLGQMADRDRFMERAVQLFKNPELADREEMSLLDGRILDRYTAPLRGEDGELFGRAWYYRDISDRKRAESMLAANNQRFAFLAEASTVVGGSLDLEQTLQTLSQISVPYLADICIVDIVEPDGSVRRVAVQADDQEKLAYIESQLTRRHVDIDPDAPRGLPKVLRTGISEMAADIEDAWIVRAARGEADYAARIRSMGFRSYMCVPLIARGHIHGAITFLAAESGRRYGPSDLALAEDLARRAALAVDNARLFAERQHVARTLQDSLLPPSLPEIPGMDLGAVFHFAGKGTEVGGDFYDIFDIGEGEWAIVMGDVCGKGARAAAVTALARYTIRAAAMQARKPNRVLATLNEAILRQQVEDRFCTVAYARLSDVENGSRKLTVACGGHPPPLVLRASGAVEAIGAPGSLLGVFAEPDLSDMTTILDPGDVVVLYTDGVTEARNDDGELGEEGLRDLVASCKNLDAAAIAAKIGSYAINLQAGEPRDDIAVVVARVS